MDSGPVFFVAMPLTSKENGEGKERGEDPGDGPGKMSEWVHLY